MCNQRCRDTTVSQVTDSNIEPVWEHDDHIIRFFPMGVVFPVAM